MPNRNWTSGEELLETHQWLGPPRPTNAVPRLAGRLPHQLRYYLPQHTRPVSWLSTGSDKPKVIDRREDKKDGRLKVAFGGATK